MSNSLNKDKNVSLRLTLEEWQELNLRAARAGSGIATYLYDLAFPGKRVPGKKSRTITVGKSITKEITNSKEHSKTNSKAIREASQISVSDYDYSD